MAKIKTSVEIKFDKLGALQKPILDAVGKKMPGSRVDLVPMPNGHIAMYVRWPGFEGKEIAVRETLAREAVNSARRGSDKLFSLFLTLTPAEAADLKAS